MAWMNGVAMGPAAYQPTSVEHWANMVTHGLFVLPAVYGAVFMVTAAHCSLHQMAAAIYGIGLAGLFSVSTFFHIVFYLGYYKKLKEVLHRSDRAMIYVFIATSYTPWLLLRPLPQESWTLHLRWGIWVLAVVGILYQQMFHERFKMLETVFYLVIGIMPSMAVMDMVFKVLFGFPWRAGVTQPMTVQDWQSSSWVAPSMCWALCSSSWMGVCLLHMLSGTSLWSWPPSSTTMRFSPTSFCPRPAQRTLRPGYRMRDSVMHQSRMSVQYSRGMRVRFTTLLFCGQIVQVLILR